MVDLKKAKLGFAGAPHLEVPLTYPITVDDVPYDRVRIRRMRACEVAEYIRRSRAIFGFQDGDPEPETPEMRVYSLIPADKGDVISDLSGDELALALEDDDLGEVFDRGVSFYPRRLQAASEPSPEDGEDTSPSSQASSTPPSENSSEPTGSTSSNTSTTP